MEFVDNCEDLLMKEDVVSVTCLVSAAVFAASAHCCC